jgi:hypothetical protein
MFARRRFVSYWCVQGFRPCRVAIYVLRTTRLLADYGTVYLHLKKMNTTKNRNRIMREQTPRKLTFDLLSIVDWPASIVSYRWRIISITAFFLSISWLGGLPFTGRLGWTAWLSSGFVDHPHFFNQPIVLLSHRLLLLILFDLFFRKMASTHAPLFRSKYLLLRNLLESDIFLDSKMAQRI